MSFCVRKKKSEFKNESRISDPSLHLKYLLILSSCRRSYLYQGRHQFPMYGTYVISELSTIKLLSLILKQNIGIITIHAARRNFAVLFNTVLHCVFDMWAKTTYARYSNKFYCFQIVFTQIDLGIRLRLTLLTPPPPSR